MEYERPPSERGSVTVVENTDNREYPEIRVLQEDVEAHGEAHVNFEHVDEGDVEVRLRTARFNYRNGLIEIWDGDNNVRFSMDTYVSHYLPMNVYH
jgi:hypothetical protein